MRAVDRRLDYDCPHGDRGQQSEVMTWQQVKAEGLWLLDDAARDSSMEPHLAEYLSVVRYAADHPNGRGMGDHNLIVRACRAAMVKLHGAASTVIVAL